MTCAYLGSAAKKLASINWNAWSFWLPLVPLVSPFSLVNATSLHLNPTVWSSPAASFLQRAAPPDKTYAGHKFRSVWREATSSTGIIGAKRQLAVRQCARKGKKCGVTGNWSGGRGTTNTSWVCDQHLAKSDNQRKQLLPLHFSPWSSAEEGGVLVGEQTLSKSPRARASMVSQAQIVSKFLHYVEIHHLSRQPPNPVSPHSGHRRANSRSVVSLVDQISAYQCTLTRSSKMNAAPVSNIQLK